MIVKMYKLQYAIFSLTMTITTTFQRLSITCRWDSGRLGNETALGGTLIAVKEETKEVIVVVECELVSGGDFEQTTWRTLLWRRVPLFDVITTTSFLLRCSLQLFPIFVSPLVQIWSSFADWKEELESSQLLNLAAVNKLVDSGDAYR